MGKYPLVKIGDVCHIEKGQTGIASAIPGEYPLVVTAKERKSSITYQFDTEAVCIPLVSSTGHGKKSLNHVHFQSGKFALGTILAAVIPNNPSQLSASFLQHYLQFYKDTKLVVLMKGAANVSLSIKSIASIEIPLPPIEEQNRLIAIFDKAKDFGDKFLDLAELQFKYINKLRQAILQEAIEGQLTAHWRGRNPVKKGNSDFDASALLEQIKAEKKNLIAKGKIKKEKVFESANLERVLFELPKSWSWCYLGEISSLITSGSRNWKNYYADSGIPLIRSQDIKKDKLEFDNQVFVSINGRVEGDRTKINIHDLLITITGGNVGKCAFLSEEVEMSYVSQHVALVRLINPLIGVYAHLWLTCEYGGRRLLVGSSYGDKPGLNLNQLSKLPFPLPSLKEQKAIVERVEKLTAMVDGLEAQVLERKGQTEGLMRSFLQEVFC